MSTSQLEHLRLLKAHLETLIETAKKRTPGEWESKAGGELLRNINSGSQVICTVAMRRGAGNLHFIASCAGNAEAGWKSTLGVIDAYYKAGICQEWQGYMQSAIEPILAAWPIETLKP